MTSFSQMPGDASDGIMFFQAAQQSRPVVSRAARF
jgi:hypothetical protein